MFVIESEYVCIRDVQCHYCRQKCERQEQYTTAVARAACLSLVAMGYVCDSQLGPVKDHCLLLGDEHTL